MRTTTTAITTYLLLGCCLLAVPGCATRGVIRKMILRCADNSGSPDVYAYKENYYCVDSVIPTNASPTDMLSVKPASIPEDVVIYGLEEFVGLSGKEEDFDRIVSAIVGGIRTRGGVWMNMLAGDRMICLRIAYIADHKHLMFQDMCYATEKVFGSVDLSDVDVSIKPGAPRKETGKNRDMETELRKARKLQDEGLIDDAEYKQMKARIISK